MKRILSLIFFSFVLLSSQSIFSQDIRNNPTSNHGNKFEQLGFILNTPNVYRTASGAPGEKYWQQRADYDIQCRLDEKTFMLYGEELITYTNNSPHTLDYLWMQLDENEHDPKVFSNIFNSSKMKPELSKKQFLFLHDPEKYLDGLGVKIEKVAKEDKKTDIPFYINQTMMRIDLDKPLRPNETITFYVKWHYQIPDRINIPGCRGGYEYFKDEDNSIFTISQWYPRMCVYSDFEGWQNHYFSGRGEFALTFGDFKVSIDVPADHVVGATGVCQNYDEVLSKEERKRMDQAKTSNEPIEIVNLNEAKTKEKDHSTQRKTWLFEAENVRDFAWTSSRKFVWDAMEIQIENKPILCMSFYAKEAYGLYRPFSTKVVAHTLRSYSHYTIPYPYPIAQSVEGVNGMEYPMICFNYGRPDTDGTYSESIKNGMISVIIHEVGHNFFPMIINSDERQWSWFDEGLNTFLQFITEQSFDKNYPSRRGFPHHIVRYMSLPPNQLEPIMTNSENIIHFGANAYGKPATALNILRETIMGRDLFDYAFKQYAKRWAFKHPTPSDFFRTMEDASGVDLDWFWRGWFYGINPVDVSLDSVVHYYWKPKDFDLSIIDSIKDEQLDAPFLTLTQARNRDDEDAVFAVEEDPGLKDFYTDFKRWESPDSVMYRTYKKYGDTLTTAEKEELVKDKYIYELHFSNKGGLVTPVIIQWQYKDGSTSMVKVPAEIWRKNENKFTKVFILNKELEKIQIDPHLETADIDVSNNVWPSTYSKSPFDIFEAVKPKRGQSTHYNPMKRVKKQ